MAKFLITVVATAHLGGELIGSGPFVRITRDLPDHDDIALAQGVIAEITAGIKSWFDEFETKIKLSDAVSGVSSISVTKL